MPRILLAIFVLPLLVLGGCRQKPSETTAPSPTAPAQEPSDLITADELKDKFQVLFETSAGNFTVEVIPSWSPLGVARFKQLIDEKFYDENRFFRNVPGFIVQWGMHGTPSVQKQWQNNKIPDDPHVVENKRGTISFATSGPNSRTSQLFINLGDNTGSLDPQGFTPFGRVIEGMDVVDALTAEYGQTPDQQQILYKGNEYLNANFPNLDYIKTARIIEVTEDTEGEAPIPAPATTSEPAPASTSAPATPESTTAAPASTSTPEKPAETIESVQ